MDEPLYTTQEVAERLKVAQKTVREWIGRGELVAIDLGQGYRVLQSDLETFLQARRGRRRKKDLSIALKSQAAE